MGKHVIRTPADCRRENGGQCKYADTEWCPTCDWALSVCILCGEYEAGLENDCCPKQTKEQTVDDVQCLQAGDMLEERGMDYAAKVLRVHANLNKPKEMKPASIVSVAEGGTCGTKENPHDDNGGFMMGFCTKCGECLG